MYAWEGLGGIAELLIDAGADVNAKIVANTLEAGMTPLDFSIRVGDIETVDLLLKHGGKTGEGLKAERK